MGNYLNRTEGGSLEELLDISKQQKKGESQKVRKLLALLLLKKANDLFIQPHKEYRYLPCGYFLQTVGAQKSQKCKYQSGDNRNTWGKARINQ